GVEAVKAFYPTGSYSTSDHGHGKPACAAYMPHKSKDATYSFEVFFPKNFDWVKGGKLPGLQGGEDHCSGGDRDAKSSSCWSVRVMWRAKGDAEAYMYVPDPQGQGLCGEASADCDEEFGVSVDRGVLKFIAGQWNKVSLTVRTNQGGSKGYMKLEINGKSIERNNVIYSKEGKLGVNSASFQTFFGGGSKYFAVKNPAGDSAYFRGFNI
ncbi:hypothetical protein BJ684DRAFT_6373, partial [Piptocephalis cylindrospora]